MNRSPLAADQPNSKAAAPTRPRTGIAREATEVHHSGLSIIASKIAPAAPGRSVLSRPRLVDWLLNQGRSRLVLVSAEAGYGKTTLLTEFSLQTRDTCVWYRIEASDGDWITFLSYMVATLRDVWPGFGRSTEALLRNVAAMGSTREVVLAQFLADLGDVDDRRIAVILDDFHFVEDSPDVRMILSRLLERAPAGMYFVLGGRGAPNLALGRLRAQGRVAELTIDDMRFTLDEIEQLFANAYGQPLDAAACRTILRRTEGWAASLQLVSASIAVSSPGEVAGFIEALSGATGPVYDFLAEEVLTRLTPQTQRILIHASLVDRVRPQYVAVALEASGCGDDVAAVGSALDDAEALGLLGERRRGTGGRRLHPLFREFLEVHLQRDTPQEQIHAMHHAIAVEAESDDWLMAAKHYARAGDSADSLRVLGSAASEALGTGAWGAAVAIIEDLPDTKAPPAVKVIEARALISDEDLSGALSLLSDIDRTGLSPEERGLVGLTRAAIHHMTGASTELNAEIQAIAADSDVPSPLHEVAVSWRQLLVAVGGGSITDAVQTLRRVEVGQKRDDLHYFCGVTLHNLAYAELARGNYAQARDLARAAIGQLERTDDGVAMTASTRATVAAAVAELGDFEDGLRLANACASEPGAVADAMADAAYMHAVCGHAGRAATLLARFDRGEARWPSELGAQAQGEFARLALRLAEGRVDEAQDVAQQLVRREPQAIDAASRTAVVSATMAIVARSPDSRKLAARAMQVCSRQHAWRWMARARLLDAVARRDGSALALWITEVERESALAIPELADAITTVVGAIVPLPAALERSILREPARWVRALARQVQQAGGDDAAAAASLIARFGAAEDAGLLRDYDRLPSGKYRKAGLANQLIRRVSPTVRVHDLGLTSFEVGGRLVRLTETRRKSGALLLFMVTRYGLAANRELVMENLWPDQSPKSALNSLHQTIFYLRRDIEPWYEDGSTADYIHVDAELVRLDADLFQIDSVAFARQAADIVASHSAATRGPELLALYKGAFAPEFEYEEWAHEWRTYVHTAYLRLAHATCDALISEHRHGEVVDVLTPLATLDPTAYELRAVLVGALASVGATDAAQAQFRSLAASHERDIGLPLRSYEEMVEAMRGR